MPAWFEATLDIAQAESVPVVLLFDSYSDRGCADLGGGHVDAALRLIRPMARERGVPLWIAADIDPALADASSYEDLLNHATPEAACRMSRLLGSGPVADVLLGTAGGGPHPMETEVE